MKRLIFTLFTIAGLFSIASAQYVDQALIFSQQRFGSTARSQAMGGAFGALGGDFSSLSINPAGIAIYQRPEVSVTANLLGINNTQSTYQGQTADDRSTTFNFRNLGYVFAGPPANAGSSGLVSLSFGMGFNRLNSFNQNISTQALGSSYSRTDAFALDSKGIPSSAFFKENDPYNNVPWESKLAWENYLINVTNPDANGVGNQYTSAITSTVDQLQILSRDGYVNEYLVAGGANFNHQLYLGATIGFHDLYYNETSNYSEVGNFGDFTYLNSNSLRGTGVNFKVGLIYRPVSELRIGAAIHTPTFYSLKENYDASMSSNSLPDGEYTPLGEYKYKLETPFRGIGSVAYQFGKKGLISFDYEYVDYSKMKLRNKEDAININIDNQNIRSKYTAVSNFHLGGELKATDMLSLRAGYEWFGNPYKSVISDDQIYKDNKHFSINTGLGFRFENVAIDLSYSLNNKTNYIYMDNVDPNPVKYKSLNHDIMLTVALKL